MAGRTATDPFAGARAKAEEAFAQHEMTVLHADGVYRHLRFARPKTWIYGFDLVTWPGYLYVGGDIEDFTFSRIPDMFEFFDGSDINPHYWGEKLTNRGMQTRRFSEQVFERRVAQAIAGTEDSEALASAWAEHRRYADLSHEYPARQALMEFEHDGHYRFPDSWEWDLHEWDPHFLLSCFAIARGLAMWKARQVEAVSS